jgi:hypothetical protein
LLSDRLPTHAADTVGGEILRDRASRSLSNGSNGGNRRSLDVVQVDDLLRNLASGSLLRAVAGDVASLSALVASLASRVERAAVGSSAVARDVAQLTTRVALHGLSLTVASKVVGAAALVAGGWTRTASETATAIASDEAAATHGHATAHGANRVGASASKMAWLAAVVAATAGSGATQTKGRAVSLDMAKTLAVVALLGLSGTRQRAAVGLVAWLLAVVAETLGGRANLGIVANIATLVASPT